MENLKIQYNFNTLVFNNKIDNVKLRASDEHKSIEFCITKGDAVDIIKHLSEWAGIELPSENNHKALRLPDVVGCDLCGCGKPKVIHICKNCNREIKHS